MADFHQPAIPTLHALAPHRRHQMADALDNEGAARTALVLPALAAEFDHPGMERILDELAECRFLSRIVIALGQADAHTCAVVQHRFERCPATVDVLPVDDPATDLLLARCRRAGVETGEPGKGRAVWLAIGHVLARGDCDAIVMHDADIRQYSRALPASLAFPVAGGLGFRFAKGYYARVHGQLYGRVTRLLVAPLIRAIEACGLRTPFLTLLGDLRYPLSGEVALASATAERLPVPTGWGLEIATLAHVAREVPLEQCCQVEIADVYEHRHKPLRPGPSGAGLRRMALEVAAAILSAVAREGTAILPSRARELRSCFAAAAKPLIARYRADALFNGLQYDGASERYAAASFAAIIEDAVALAAECRSVELPSWLTVREAMPHLFAELGTLVDRTRARRPIAPVLLGGPHGVPTMGTDVPFPVAGMA